ncbi:MAG: hypothetical protein WA364_08920 [Candidatus Nitrosopolaris sp.]
MDYDKLSKDILELDSKIRFVGVCADSGETRYGYQREGVKNLLSHDESKKANLQAMTRWGRNSLASKICRGRHTMAEDEKIKRMTIPLGIDHVMLITTEVTANLEITNNILKWLENWRDENVLSAVL